MAQEDAPPEKKMRLTGTFVTLKVGAGDGVKVFSAHEGLVKQCSEFFQSAFDRKWKEGQSREIELPDDEPEVVDLFLEWLYNVDSLKAFVMAEPYPLTKETFSKLCKLYVFGEKIQSDSLCNNALAAILKFTTRPNKQGHYPFPMMDCVDTIYEGTPSLSPARKLMVHLHVSFGAPTWLRDTGNHPEFLQDLVVGLLSSRKQPAFKDLFQQRETWYKK